ncbi:DUF4349 domain-containing protein [Flavobacterium jejuense]|uniref:DUF4349 domain-containing protein n=1 Tax=Flavobacterium jejuense TaxID=1544455 RepID=A0ABX0IPQ2_9FLAO|nr:DUF4349 domain-containing protein [Flavobacterium jejuense]NHN25551.1 DUF4349 domain-containing protein [Flavobacterium jejuense]
MKRIFSYFLLSLLVFSCKEEMIESSLTENANYSYDAVEESEPLSISNLKNIDAKSKINSEDPKIIKTAHLRFETQDLQNSFSNIYKTAKIYKAYIQNDNSGTDYGSIYRNITLRIPNTNFDAFIAEISKGVSYFDRKEIAAQDVTEEFVDIEARLKAKHTLEIRYLEILKKANKVSEILEIEKELSAIREEIEVAEGRLKYLQNRVSMSTISIEMYTEKPEGTGTTVSYGSKMWNAVKSGFNGLSSFFLGMLHIWPFILIFVVLFFFVRKKIRNKKKL